LGGAAARVLGLGAFMLLPSLGLIEALLGIWALRTPHPLVSLLAVLPSGLLLAYALQGMVGTNRSDYRLSVPLALVSAVTAVLLIQEYMVARSSGVRIQAPRDSE
jgi:hypothetical protein